MGDTVKFHPHTGEPLRPLWIRPDGRAMWPILGASPDDPAPADPAPSDPAPTPDPKPADPPKPADDPKPSDNPDEPLGEPGKKALQAERDARKALEKQVSDMQAAQQTQMDALAKALGLKQDEPPDPAKLAEQVSQEQARAREAQTQLAVYRRAAAAEANPAALLDSASFLASVAKIDPTDEAAVDNAIKAAIEANPLLKAAPAVPPFPGGPRSPASQPDPGPGLPRLRNAYAQNSK